MRRRLAVGTLIGALGWSTASVAFQAPQDAPAAEPSVEIVDPFAQFDLGVASLAEGATVETWTPLKTSGLTFIPEAVIVTAGQTIGSLLLERGVRPDAYSRSLIAEINPGLGDDFALAEGQAVTLFRVDGRPGGRFAEGMIAIQPFQAERETVRSLLTQIDETQPADAEALRSWNRLTARVAQAEQRVTLTRRQQLIEAGSALESYNTGLMAALGSGEGGRPPREASYAMVSSGTRAAVAALSDLEDDERPASLRVQVSSTGPTPSGVCEIGWAPLGFAPYEGSRVYEEYRTPVVIRVPASDLHVWVARSEDEPSPRSLRTVRKQQLISGATHPITIPTEGACAQ